MKKRWAIVKKITTYVYNYSTNYGGSDCNQVDSQLELNEFRYTVVNVTTPFHSLNDTVEVVVGQYDIWCFLCNISSLYTLRQVNDDLRMLFNRATPFKCLSKEIKNSKHYFKQFKSEKTTKQTIANPTSAFLRAGPSFVPSPVTATISRVFEILLSMIPFTKVYLSSGDERANTRSRGQISSKRLCLNCKERGNHQIYRIRVIEGFVTFQIRNGRRNLAREKEKF